MILKPQLEDIKIIGYYLGKIIIGLGLCMLVPIFIALIFEEWVPILDFLIGTSITFSLGIFLIMVFQTEKELTLLHSMVIVALSWLFAMFLGAIPLFLSGHYKSYLDSCFEAMSGFATTGLTLVQNLDHLSKTHNFWRHLTMFIGGQGIVIVALSILGSSFSGTFKIYIGEAREEKILPNVVHTSRFIWLVSITYLILGTIFLGTVGILEGIKTKNAFFNAICVFMAGFDTGGFGVYSQNILYYHSFSYELITIGFMLLGALNFNLHYQFWNGNFKELYKDTEIKTFFLSITFLFFFIALGLCFSKIYPKTILLFRKGFYQFISAHTGTGYSTIYSSRLVKEWSNFSKFLLIIAMAFGGGVCSTTGAIKMLRIAIFFKTLKEYIKRIMLSEKILVMEKIHHLKDLILEDRQINLVFLIILTYITIYLAGALVGVFYGYPFLDSLFESISATANVGLSSGITKTTMPIGLKFVYIFQMWAGRLEFMAIFTLFGFLVSIFKGK